MFILAKFLTFNTLEIQILDLVYMVTSYTFVDGKRNDFCKAISGIHGDNNSIFYHQQSGQCWGNLIIAISHTTGQRTKHIDMIRQHFVDNTLTMVF
jgi:hypothetical protein